MTAWHIVSDQSVSESNVTAAFETWLRANPTRETEIWLRISSPGVYAITRGGSEGLVAAAAGSVGHVDFTL
jgi:hypothetical protein